MNANGNTWSKHLVSNKEFGMHQMIPNNRYMVSKKRAFRIYSLLWYRGRYPMANGFNIVLYMAIMKPSSSVVGCSILVCSVVGFESRFKLRKNYEENDKEKAAVS